MQTRLKRKKALKADSGRHPWTGISALTLAFVLGVLCPYTCYVGACIASLVEECTPAIAHETAHGKSHDHDDCKEPLAHDHDLLYSHPSLTRRVATDQNVMLPVCLTYAVFRVPPHASPVTYARVLPPRALPTETVRLLI